MIKTRSDATLVWLQNAAAVGGGPGSTSIVNSAGWVVNIGNSAGWTVNVANTGGSVVVSNTQTSINIINSAGWIFAQSNTAGESTYIINSAGWVVSVANTSPLVSVQNSAGWSVIVSNTSPIAISNTAGWSVVVSNTQTAINIINSAGWSVVVSNTSPVAISNTANWIIYTIDSRPTGTAITLVLSTAGQVLLLASNANRRAASIYNQSTNPLYMRLGSSVSATTYTLMIVSSGYYEIQNPVYTGIITGIWSAANGQAVITEGT